jgi:hypothetical protein
LLSIVPHAGETDPTDAWNPNKSPHLWVGYVAFLLWTVAQPILGEGLLREPRIVVPLQWLIGSLLIYVGLFAVQFGEAAPYRSILRTARRAHPDALVFGVRLDPLTTPVGVDRGDPRDIRWGLIRVSSHGAEIVRSDGLVMLDCPWTHFEVSFRGLDVDGESGVEEWWLQLLSDSGVWAPALLARRNRNRFLRMQELRPDSASD